MHLGRFILLYLRIITLQCYFLILKALKIARELHDRIGEAVVCANLGSNYEMLGDIARALEYHEKVFL